MTGIRFDGQVAIVTGAGNGIGRSYALELARRGAKVIVNNHQSPSDGNGDGRSSAETAVDEIRAQEGFAIANDDSVATRAGGASIVEDALTTFGRLDILIANAGFQRNARFEDLTDAQIDAVLNVHLKAAFYVGQPAFKAMRSRGYGRILFTGSAVAMFGNSWNANYAAAKGGVAGLSNAIAVEGSAYGIHSNVILPVARSRQEKETAPEFLEIPRVAAAVARVDLPAVDHRLTPDFNTPLALYLVSEGCVASHGVYSSCAGRYARVRIAVDDGWHAPAGSLPPTPEDLAANFDAIGARSSPHEPWTAFDELADVIAEGRRRGTLA